MKEEWRDVVGYEGYYQVSNMGRVKSLDRYIQCKDGRTKLYKGSLKKTTKHKIGYMCVGLNIDDVFSLYYVHRLVAIAFINGDHFDREVNHINEIRDDNRLINLEWVTHRENINHGTCPKRISEKGSRPVIGICVYSGLPHFYTSLSRARIDGYDSTSISKCCHKKLKTHKNKYWIRDI